MPQRSSSVSTGLRKNLDQRMIVYSAAALAAGVSVLALSQPSDAEVVVTRKTIAITPGFNTTTVVKVDLNRDGIPDFQFSLYDLQYHSEDADLGIRPLTEGAVVGTPGLKPGFFYASALARGARVGPSAQFSSRVQVQVSQVPYSPSNYYRKVYGKWQNNPSNRYIGVRFLINGATHYGWIRLSVNSPRFPMSATITAFAYETVPNKPILAGISPSSATDDEVSRGVPGIPSLGMLALGADGLAIWRREESLPS